jgi:hypothetical protein
LLVQAAQAAARFCRIAARRGHKKAVVALAPALLVIIYHGIAHRHTTTNLEVTIDNGRAGLWVPPRRHMYEQGEVMDDSFETLRGHPPPGLLIDHFPSWEVDWQHPPRRASAHHPA